MRKVLITSAAVGLLTVLGPGGARADTTTLNINTPNAAIAGFTGPYATVDVNRTNATHATITFTSLTNGGYLYLMGDGGIADVNVNGTYNLGTITESNSVAGLTPVYKDNTPGQVDGLGQFNLSLNNMGGFSDSATSISFNLTATGATSWASATSVLTPNAQGFEAAIHVFPCAVTCTSNSSAPTTGYAGNNGGTPMNVHEPWSVSLLGMGLVGIGAVRSRQRRNNLAVSGAGFA